MSLIRDPFFSWLHSLKRPEKVTDKRLLREDTANNNWIQNLSVWLKNDITVPNPTVIREDSTDALGPYQFRWSDSLIQES